MRNLPIYTRITHMYIIHNHGMWLRQKIKCKHDHCHRCITRAHSICIKHIDQYGEWDPSMSKYVCSSYVLLFKLISDKHGKIN